MKDAYSVLIAVFVCVGVFAAAYLFDHALGVTSLWLFFFPFLLSLFSGIIRGLLFGKYDSMRFSIEIFKANFHFERDLDYWHGVKTILSRLLWEQPQTMLGNIAMQVLNSVWLIRRTDFYKDTLICQGSFLNGGGIAFGSFLMIDLLSKPTLDILPMDDRTVPERILIRHEYGHALQSRASGPLFIFKYGFPSILMQGWTEVDADYRSDKELLISEQIMPVFSNHRNVSKPLNPKWWEFAFLLALIVAGAWVNSLQGVAGSLLIGSIFITALNIKHPA